MSGTDIRYVDVAGIRTAYSDTGQGTTLLLVHGGDYSGFGSGADWDLNLPGLIEAGFRVVVPDKLGQGRTGNPSRSADYTMHAVVEHLRAFIARLGLTDFVLVGHSRGALPALHIALDAPQTLRALVLVDSNTVGRDSPLVPQDFYPRAYAGIAEPPSTADVAREAEMNSYAAVHLTPNYLARRTSDAALPEAAERRHTLAIGALPDVFLPDIARLKAETADRVEAGELQLDTLVVWGADDPSAPLPLGLDLFRAIAEHNRHRTELHVLNHAGHYSFREQPAAFDRVVTGFVREG